jgi:hypothetical protein
VLHRSRLRERYSIPVLPEIRIDASVPKCPAGAKALADYDPCRAIQDYRVAF